MTTEMFVLLKQCELQALITFRESCIMENNDRLRKGQAMAWPDLDGIGKDIDKIITDIKNWEKDKTKI